MADAIQGKKANTTTYLRQIQQEKAKYKRELMEAQKADMKAVRDYYADQSKQLEEQSAAAVVEIKEEARQMAEADRQARADSAAQLAEQKQTAREQRLAGVRKPANSDDAGESAVEKKNLYTRKSPVIQNYQTRDSDEFYKVQDRGSRMSEGPGYYIIEAYAPDHEKDNLRVSIQRNKAVISGQRKFQDEADQDGKVLRTSNYQSFREEFKFDRPVTGQGMTRERVGDYIRFSIPKLEAMENMRMDEDT